MKSNLPPHFFSMTNQDRGFIKFSIILAVFLVITYLPVFMPEPVLDAFAREDYIFEWLTMLYFFMTSIVFFALFLQSINKNKYNNVTRLKKLSYILLALLFFVAAGEEISWGERIFNFENSLVSSVNVQNEFNIHNLKYFQGEESILPFSLSQLGIAFMFVFVFLIPLAGYIYKPINDSLNKIIPVLPLSIGVLIPINYLIQKILKRLLPVFPELYLHDSMTFSVAIHEIREHGYALVFLVSSLLFAGSLMLKNRIADSNKN